jgi:hypothetical protein
VGLHADKVHVAENHRHGERHHAGYVSGPSSLTRLSTRTTRFFYYGWRGQALPNQDCGLISYLSNATRDLYTIYKEETNP